jgi:hypothetical protein
MTLPELSGMLNKNVPVNRRSRPAYLGEAEIVWSQGWIVTTARFHRIHIMLAPTTKINCGLTYGVLRFEA